MQYEAEKLEADEKARLKRIGETAKRNTRILPYALEKRGLFIYSTNFTRIWPFISAITIMIFVFFFARDSVNITDFASTDAKTILGFVAVLVVASMVCTFIEYQKAQLNRSFWRKFYAEDGFGIWLVISFVSLSLISSLGSALGAYMTSLEASGYKVQIQKESALRAAEKRHDTTLQGIDRSISAASNAAGHTKQQIDNLRGDQVKEGGKFVTKYVSSNAAAKLAPTLSVQVDRIAALEAERAANAQNHFSEIQTIEGQFAEIAPSLWGFSPGMAGKNIAVMVFVLILAAETLFIYANSRIWAYWQKTADELSVHIPANVNNKKESESRADGEQVDDTGTGQAEKYDTNAYRERQRKQIEQARKRFVEREGREPSKADLQRETGFSYSKIRNYV